MAWTMESIDNIYQHYCEEVEGLSDLDIVEAIAEDRNKYHQGNFFENEEAVSASFDELYAESLNPDDEVEINETFSCYTDSLCKEGRLHAEQYQSYEYVGKLKTD